jgi:hypothetical protein
MNSVTDLLAHPISGTWRNRPPNVLSDDCLIELIPRCSEYTLYTDCTPAATGLQNDCIF